MPVLESERSHSESDNSADRGHLFGQLGAKGPLPFRNELLVACGIVERLRLELPPPDSTIRRNTGGVVLLEECIQRFGWRPPVQTLSGSRV